MKREKILIALIDDEVDLCVVLSAMLKANGFDVDYYHTLAAGLQGIRTTQPDWVIIDNNLPDGLGWEKVGDIMESVPDASIIKISANPDSARDKHREFIHYLIKPINVNSVIRLIAAKNT